MGVSGPQVSLPDPKSPALGRLMSWDAWPGAGQRLVSSGGQRGAPPTCWLLRSKVHKGSREEVCLQGGQRRAQGPSGHCGGWQRGPHCTSMLASWVLHP